MQEITPATGSSVRSGQLVVEQQWSKKQDCMEPPARLG